MDASRHAAIWSSRCHVECILKTSRWIMGTWAKLFHFVCFLHRSASWSCRPATSRIFPPGWTVPSRITPRPKEQYTDHESTASRRQPKSSSPSHASRVSKHQHSLEASLLHLSLEEHQWASFWLVWWLLYNTFSLFHRFSQWFWFQIVIISVLYSLRDYCVPNRIGDWEEALI